MPVVLLFSAIGRSHLGNPGLVISGRSQPRNGWSACSQKATSVELARASCRHRSRGEWWAVERPRVVFVAPYSADVVPATECCPSTRVPVICPAFFHATVEGFGLAMNDRITSGSDASPTLNARARGWLRFLWRKATMPVNTPLPDLCREHRAEPVPPETHRLVADVDATLEQEILDLP